jgi:hypothetical protein
MMKRSIIFLCFIFSLSASDKAELIFLSQFEGAKENFTSELLKLKNVELAPKEGVKGSTAIKVSYVPSKRGSERVTRSYKIPKPVNELTLNFDVKFDENFDWAKGGKLHGVGPSKSITGGNKITADGWSARLMFKSKGQLSTYVYKQDMKGEYGDSDVMSLGMKKDRYYAISLYVKLNTAGQKDGEIHCYVDGKLKKRLKKQMLRGGTDESVGKIESILFNTFHGGHTSDWSPRLKGKPTTCYVFYDNFAAYKGLNIRKGPGK